MPSPNNIEISNYDDMKGLGHKTNPPNYSTVESAGNQERATKKEGLKAGELGADVNVWGLWERVIRCRMPSSSLDA